MSERDAAGVEPGTILRKIVHPAIAQLYLGNVAVPGKFEPHRAAGPVVRGADFPQGTAEEFAEVFGVDRIEGWPTGTQYVLRFQAHTTEIFEASGAEYAMELAELPAGTELWRIEPDGGHQRVGGYANRQIGWIPEGDVDFGPGRYWRAPVSPRTTVRRGLIGRYRGQDFDIDFAGDPGQVLLHPLTGDPAPPDFTELQGARFLEVPDTAVEDFGLARKFCTYRDAEFEIIGFLGDTAVLHCVGEHHETAQRLGLSEVDFRQWRTFVLRTDLSDVRDEFRSLGRS